MKNKALIGAIAVATMAGIAGIGTIASANSNGQGLGFRGPNEETRQVMDEAHKLRQAGDWAGAEAIMQELGIEKPGHGLRGQGMQNREAVMNAVDNNDFEAFHEAVTGTPLADEITADNFSKFVEMNQAMRNGDVDKADSLRDEIGLPDRGSRGHGFGDRVGQDS